MADEFAPQNLRARLATLQDRITQARDLSSKLMVSSATTKLDVLTDLIDQHDEIRGSLDDQKTVTELQHSKASAQTDAALKLALCNTMASKASKANSATPVGAPQPQRLGLDRSHTRSPERSIRHARGVRRI